MVCATIYLRLHSELVELSSGVAVSEEDGLIVVRDIGGKVVARLEKLDALAWSHDPKLLRLDLDLPRAEIASEATGTVAP